MSQAPYVSLLSPYISLYLPNTLQGEEVVSQARSLLFKSVKVSNPRPNPNPNPNHIPNANPDPKPEPNPNP